MTVRRIEKQLWKAGMEILKASGSGNVLVLVGILCAIHATAESVDEGTAEIRSSWSDETIEEVVVEGSIDDIVNPILMREVRIDNGRGGRLYRRGRYKEALPYLESAAQSGFKLAQARVSYIYQQGLGGVGRNVRAAVGWIGVAASPTTNQEIRNYFKRFIAHIPTEHMPLVNRIVADYTEKYGSKSVGLFCNNTRLAGSHISRLKCDFKDEYAFRDQIDYETNTQGIEASGQTASFVSTPF